VVVSNSAVRHPWADANASFAPHVHYLPMGEPFISTPPETIVSRALFLEELTCGRRNIMLGLVWRGPILRRKVATDWQIPG